MTKVEFIEAPSELEGWNIGESYGGWLTELDGRRVARVRLDRAVLTKTEPAAE